MELKGGRVGVVGRRVFLLLLGLMDGGEFYWIGLDSVREKYGFLIMITIQKVHVERG